MPGPRFLWVSPKCSLQSILEEIYQIYIQILSASHMKSNPLPVSPIKPSSKSSNVGFCLNLHLFSRSFPLSPPVTAVANVRPVGSGLAHPWHHCGAAMVAANIGGFGADQSYGEFIYGYIYNIYVYGYIIPKLNLTCFILLGQSNVSRRSSIMIVASIGPSSLLTEENPM